MPPGVAREVVSLCSESSDARPVYDDKCRSELKASKPEPVHSGRAVQ